MEDIDNDGRSDVPLEISDDETQEALDTKGQALKEGLNFMLHNLEVAPRQGGNLAAEEQATKRPRTKAPDGSSAALSQHFAMPGQ